MTLHECGRGSPLVANWSQSNLRRLAQRREQRGQRRPGTIPLPAPDVFLTGSACVNHSLPVGGSSSWDAIRQVVGVELSDQDAEALAGWYAGFSRGVAGFPAEDLKRVEPPLRSVPGPGLT